MTELDNNDKLLYGFFSESKQEIADKGFSRRVMSQLPDRSNRLARVWTAFTLTIGAILFILLGGLEAVLGTLRETFISMLEQQAAHLDLKSVIIAAVVLLFLGTKKLVSMA